MAMNAAILKAALKSDMISLWRNDAPSGHDRDGDYFLDKLCDVIATRVVEHITSYAKCNGIDSGSNSHSNVGII